MLDAADTTRVQTDTNLAFEIGHYYLIEAITRCFQALDKPECNGLLGPDATGATLPGGARVPGTSYELEPCVAAANIDMMIHWSDSDGATRCHEFDRFGSILAGADHQSRQARTRAEHPLFVRDVLTAVIEAREGPSVFARDHIATIIKDFEDCVAPRLAPGQWARLTVLAAEPEQLAATAVDDFMALLVV